MEKMNSPPFLIDCQLNSSFYVQALTDTGCLCFAASSNDLVTKYKLLRIQIPIKSLQLAENDNKKRTISEISFANFDIDGRREKVYGYVTQDLAYNIILGKPWMERNDVVYLAKKRAIRFDSKPDSLLIREHSWSDG
ncbi:hypothetical protein K3495_g13431 [Podosphaera aphanis]|nr:hypothetical protein K3495_g13431 [Podosphaera aphanis]